jgi:MFS family permease
MKKPVDRSIIFRFLGIAIVNALLFFSSQFFGTTLPIYLRDLSGSDAIVGICSALGTVAALIIRPISGVAVDRIGRAPVLLIGSLLIALTFGAFSFFKSVTATFVIQFINGFGWGIASTASNTIATDLIPRDRFGEWMGYFTLSQSFAMAIAPSLALAIMDVKGFAPLMLVAAGFGGIVVFLSFFFRERVPKTDVKQSFRPYERNALRPALLMLIAGTALGATFSFATLFGKSMHFSHVGLYFTCFAVTLFIGRPLVGRVIDRYGFRSMVLLGFLGYAASQLMLWQSHSEWIFLASAALQGIAYGAVQNALQTMAVISAPPERHGAATATYFTGFDAGIGLGSLISGMLAKALGYANMFGLFAIPMVVGACIYLLTEKRVNSTTETQVPAPATADAGA